MLEENSETCSGPETSPPSKRLVARWCLLKSCRSAYRTPFIRTGEKGVVLERLPSAKGCVERRREKTCWSDNPDPGSTGDNHQQQATSCPNCSEDVQQEAVKMMQSDDGDLNQGATPPLSPRIRFRMRSTAYSQARLTSGVKTSSSRFAIVSNNAARTAA